VIADGILLLYPTELRRLEDADGIRTRDLQII
jgi:hypothetical protein